MRTLSRCFHSSAHSRSVRRWSITSSWRAPCTAERRTNSSVWFRSFIPHFWCHLSWWVWNMPIQRFLQAFILKCNFIYMFIFSIPKIPNKITCFIYSTFTCNSPLSFLESRRKAYMVVTVVTHGHVWLGLYIDAPPEGLSHSTDNWLLFSPLSYAQAHSSILWRLTADRVTRQCCAAILPVCRCLSRSLCL